MATALAEARRAVVLDPGDATAHADLAFVLMERAMPTKRWKKRAGPPN